LGSLEVWIGSVAEDKGTRSQGAADPVGNKGGRGQRRRLFHSQAKTFRCIVTYPLEPTSPSELFSSQTMMGESSVGRPSMGQPDQSYMSRNSSKPTYNHSTRRNEEDDVSVWSFSDSVSGGWCCWSRPKKPTVDLRQRRESRLPTLDPIQHPNDRFPFTSPASQPAIPFQFPASPQTHTQTQVPRPTPQNLPRLDPSHLPQSPPKNDNSPSMMYPSPTISQLQTPQMSGSPSSPHVKRSSPANSPDGPVDQGMPYDGWSSKEGWK